MKKPKSTILAADRKRAAADMISYYFTSYWSDWRFVKVLTNEKLLKEKYSFFGQVTETLYQQRDEPTIAQEITHGVFHDTISQCIQYIEELFALIRASQNPDFFIKNIVTYQAGQVTNFIKGYKVTSVNVAKSFHFPHNLPFDDEAMTTQYQTAVGKLQLLVKDILFFYIDYEFFYIQYKHGLSIPMRPFGNRFSDEQIQQDKDGIFAPYLAAFDNFNLSAAVKRGTFDSRQGAIMPALTDNVTKIFTKLHDEDNYLRFVFPPFNEDGVDIKKFSAVAQKTRLCINIFKYNFLQSFITGKDVCQFHLPVDETNNRVLKISFKNDGA